MPDPSDPGLENSVHQALKNLPPLPAPASLRSRVLATIEARQRTPWWQRSWWDWPASAKTVFVLLAATLAALLHGGGWILFPQITDYSERVTAPLSSVASLWQILGDAGELPGSLWQNATHPFLTSAIFAAAALYLICLLVGTAFFRFASKQA